jgi:uncharacterized protein (UPF0335 family)
MKDNVTTTMRLGGGPEIPLDLDKLSQHIEQTLGEKHKKGKPKMKADPALDKAKEKAFEVAADELRSFLERTEQLQAEAKDISEQIKEVLAEAKGRGYDTKALRKIIALRKKKPDELAEEEAVLEVYKSALGMS